MQATRGEVLVVDDDPDVLGLVEAVLLAEGFVVRTAATSTEAIASVRADRPNVVLLDLMLADSDGLDVLTEIHALADVPVVLLTGRGAEADRVLGLRMGAEDYIVKPFSPAELVARIDTILRRVSQRPGSRPLKFGALCLDLDSREVLVDGNLIATTAKEFDLLAYLASSPRQVLSRNRSGPHPRSGRTRRPSPSTCAACGSRSRATPSGRAGSSPCGGSATASTPEHPAPLHVGTTASGRGRVDESWAGDSTRPPKRLS